MVAPPERRGLRRTRRSAEEAFLDAAERLLVRVGYAGITTRILAEEAGSNPGLVHYYFGSRIWKAQIPYLARHFRVLTFDPRGYGRSARWSATAPNVPRSSSPSCSESASRGI